MKIKCEKKRKISTVRNKKESKINCIRKKKKVKYAEKGN